MSKISIFFKYLVHLISSFLFDIILTFCLSFHPEISAVTYFLYPFIHPSFQLSNRRCIPFRIRAPRNGA